MLPDLCGIFVLFGMMALSQAVLLRYHMALEFVFFFLTRTARRNCVLVFLFSSIHSRDLVGHAIAAGRSLFCMEYRL